MDLHQKYVTSVVFLVISISIQAQNLRSSIKDDIKKDLLKQIKPILSTPGSTMEKSPLNSKAVQEDDLLEFYKKYKSGSGGAEFESKYQISPNVITYNGKDPINKQPDGYVEPVFEGGHWILANPTRRLDGLVVPSGLDLSGGGKKKLSKKSRDILINVLGMTIDE